MKRTRRIPSPFLMLLIPVFVLLALVASNSSLPEQAEHQAICPALGIKTLNGLIRTPMGMLLR